MYEVPPISVGWTDQDTLLFKAFRRHHKPRIFGKIGTLHIGGTVFNVITPNNQRPVFEVMTVVGCIQFDGANVVSYDSMLDFLTVDPNVKLITWIKEIALEFDSTNVLDSDEAAMLLQQLLADPEMPQFQEDIEQRHIRQYFQAYIPHESS